MLFNVEKPTLSCACDESKVGISEASIKSIVVPSDPSASASSDVLVLLLSFRNTQSSISNIKEIVNNKNNFFKTSLLMIALSFYVLNIQRFLIICNIIFNKICFY